MSDQVKTISRTTALRARLGAARMLLADLECRLPRCQLPESSEVDGALTQLDDVLSRLDQVLTGRE